MLHVQLSLGIEYSGCQDDEKCFSQAGGGWIIVLSDDGIRLRGRVRFLEVRGTAKIPCLTQKKYRVVRCRDGCRRLEYFSLSLLV